MLTHATALDYAQGATDFGDYHARPSEKVGQ